MQKQRLVKVKTMISLPSSSNLLNLTVINIAISNYYTSQLMVSYML